MAYQNFIFDLYGTLIDIRTDEWAKENWNTFAAWIKSEYGLQKGMTGAAIHKLYDAKVKELAAMPSPYQRPEIDILPVFQAILEAEGMEGVTEEQAYQAGEQFRILTTKMIRLYPNTKKVLQGLRAAGKNVYLLSNAQHVFTWQELILTGILEDFDDVFISSDAGTMKPDPAFYEMLFSKHGLKKEESIMVGNDTTSDIAGAAAYGIDALYVRTEISPANDPTPTCKYVFEDGDIGHVLELI